MADLSDFQRMLCVHDLSVVALSFKYKDWHISVFEDPHEGPALYVVAVVEDAYKADGSTIQLNIRSNIPPPCRYSYESFKEYVLWRIDQIERHEVRELLKYNGEVYRDPHDPIEPKIEL